MIDLRKTIEAKSDHLSADDLIGGAKTITITKVSVNSTDRPVVIEYVGGEGKSFLPCKSMRRVMVAVWGVNGVEYIGQSMTLYRDNSVKFGGQEVGGIRISHASGLKETLKLSLSATKGKKVLFQVSPLKNEKSLDDIFIDIGNAETVDDLKIIASQYSKNENFEFILPKLTSRKTKLLNPPQEIIENVESNDDFINFDDDTQTQKE